MSNENGDKDVRPAASSSSKGAKDRPVVAGVLRLGSVVGAFAVIGAVIVGFPLHVYRSWTGQTRALHSGYRAVEALHVGLTSDYLASIFGAPKIQMNTGDGFYQSDYSWKGYWIEAATKPGGHTTVQIVVSACSTHLHPSFVYRDHVVRLNVSTLASASNGPDGSFYNTPADNPGTYEEWFGLGMQDINVDYLYGHAPACFRNEGTSAFNPPVGPSIPPGFLPGESCGDYLSCAAVSQPALERFRRSIVIDSWGEFDEQSGSTPPIDFGPDSESVMRLSGAVAGP